MKLFLLILFAYLFELNINACDYNVIEGIKIEDYSTEYNEFCGDFLIPNELYSECYGELLNDRTGILISVGTFRALIAFALGNFNYLIMMDIKRDTLEYNRKLLDKIKEIVNKYPNDVQKQMDEYVLEFPCLVLMKGNKEQYYWHDPVKWQKVTQAIKDNKIYVIMGDLGDEFKNNFLSQILRELFSNFNKTFDISNVPDYVSKTNLLNTLKSFCPIYIGHFVLLTTTSSNRLKPKDGAISPTLIKTRDWNYYYSTMEDYLRYLE